MNGMRIVVDTNILIAALMARSTTHEIIILGDFQLLVPEYALEEIERNRTDLQKRMGVGTDEFFILLNLLLSHVMVVPREEYMYMEEKAKVRSNPFTNSRRSGE